ncbi:hypothetical protein GEMRC1_000332 [Eukaryota sp. GEM-RC1]
MVPYLDFHTHNKPSHGDILCINSCFVSTKDSIDLNSYFTVGIHPWQVLSETEIQSHIEEIRNLASSHHKNCIAIGECGIDKLKGSSLDQQISTFRKQLDLAIELQKPVIVHCVRAFDSLIQIRKQYPYIRMAIHGIVTSSQLMEDLSRLGFYFSIGAAVLKSTKLQQALQKIPPDRMFLETDTSDVSIVDIYDKVADIVKQSPEELKAIILTNFRNFMGI